MKPAAGFLLVDATTLSHPAASPPTMTYHPVPKSHNIIQTSKSHSQDFMLK
jgi:hypothetical protein